MKYIEDWVNKRNKCHFCGETRSVKYQVEIMTNNGMKTVCACNKCALTNRWKIS